MNGGFELVGVTAAVGVLVGRGLDFVETTATFGVFVDGISRSHAARNDTVRMNEDIFIKSRREKSFFI
jgi:hypothetical protein